FSSRRRHTRFSRDWSSDVCSSDLFAGARRGSASTSDFSAQALRETVEAAWHIARYTAEDPAAGLPEAELLARDYIDLGLHHPWRSEERRVGKEGRSRL